jgi:4-amino-4-deoxy-L-arabinose transferase-like glycosyltransferase
MGSTHDEPQRWPDSSGGWKPRTVVLSADPRHREGQSPDSVVVKTNLDLISQLEDPRNFVVAVVLAFDGLALTYSGMFMPYNPLALFTLVCGILLYRADGASMRSALMLFLGAGVAAGAAYSTKDTGILLLVPAVVWALWQTDRPLRDRLALCVAFTAGLAPV